MAVRRRAVPRRVVGVLVMAGLLAPVAVLAQTSDSVRPPLRWSMGPYLGVSRHSPVGRHWGITPGRHHFFLGLHATVPILERHRWGFSYAPEVVPVLVVTNNPNYRTLPAAPGRPAEVVEEGQSPVAGVAFAPIGLETYVRLSPRWRTYATGALGGVWFTRQAPTLDSRAFNFTFEFGGGLQWRVSSRTWLRAGYKFHHFSNARTAPSNPGVDAQVFLLGFERTYGGRPSS
jgi:opacity protein-like surface antigen